MLYCVGGLGGLFNSARQSANVMSRSVLRAMPMSRQKPFAHYLLSRRRTVGLRCHVHQPRHHRGGWAAAQQSGLAMPLRAAAQAHLLAARLRRVGHSTSINSRADSTTAIGSSSHAAGSGTDGPQEPPATPAPAVHRKAVSEAQNSMRDGWKLSDDLRTTWSMWLNRVQRVAAKQLLEQLDQQWQLGIPPGVTSYNGRPIPYAAAFFTAKVHHPLAVALVQYKTHYMALGTDAALLVEHGGFSAGSGLLVKFQEADLQKTLKQLVEVGLSVAVWQTTHHEHSDGPAPAPGRYCTLVTPENPFMIDGYADRSDDWDLQLPEIYGISLTSTHGCSVYVLDQGSRAVNVYEGLSDDCVWGVIAAAGGLGAVHLHRPLDMPRPPRSGPDAPDLENRYVLMKKSLKTRATIVREYDAVDGLEGFKDKVREVTNIGHDEDISHRPARAVVKYGGLLPLYLSTTQQLGLIAHPGVPSLPDFLLPMNSPTLVRQLLVRLLMNPPPHAVAGALRQALRMFKSEPFGFKFLAESDLNVDKVALLLREGKGNERLFWSLQRALDCVMDTALDPASGTLAHPSEVPSLEHLKRTVWPALCHIMGCDVEQLHQQDVVQATRQALQDIRSTVVDRDSNNQQPSGSGSDVAAQLCDLAESKERFVNRVRTWKIAKQVQQVQLAFDELASTASSLLTAVTAEIKYHNKLSSSDGPCLQFDNSNSAVWLKLTAKQAKELLSVSLGDAGHQQLKTPKEAGYLEAKGQHLRTCDALEQSLSAYREAVQEANKAATAALQELSNKLVPTLRELTSAVQLGILLQLLYDHAVMAEGAGWCLPAVGREEQVAAGAATESVGQHGALRLDGVFPYWMEGDHPNTIRNTISLPGMMMLTGPNMAGKSTLLRMVAAACLCACIGLNIPARSSSHVPHLDAVMLRTFSGDAPLEGLSAYAVEMHEMRYVLADTSQRSLVLVDELGKGTEVMWGTAIASLLVRKLVQKGACGIFATHLHGLVELLRDVDGIQQHSMEVQQQQEGGILVPTKKVVLGVCTRSMALDVARERGLPEPLLQRAQDYHHRLMAWCQADKPLDTLAATSATAVMQIASTASPPDSAASSADFRQEVQKQQRLVQLMLAQLGEGQPAGLQRCLGKPDGASSEDIAIAEEQVDLSQVYRLVPGRVPPPPHCGKPVVYAMRHRTNLWRVGESEDIRQRFEQHARKIDRVPKVLPRPELWYVVLKPELAAKRRELQGGLITGLDRAGIPQVSKYDAHFVRRK